MSQRQPTANAKALTLDKLASTSGNSSRRDMASAQHHTPPPVPAAPPSVPPAFAFAPVPTPALATVFQMAPLSQKDWYCVAAWALPLVLLEELLKLGARIVKD